MQCNRDGKALVHYQIDPNNHIALGQGAIVVVYDHPRLGNNNGVPVYTTEVIDLDGYFFETKNNLYRSIHAESDITKLS